jgi:hypothetical protein
VHLLTTYFMTIIPVRIKGTVSRDFRPLVFSSNNTRWSTDSWAKAVSNIDSYSRRNSNSTRSPMGLFCYTFTLMAVTKAEYFDSVLCCVCRVKPKIFLSTPHYAAYCIALSWLPAVLPSAESWLHAMQHTLNFSAYYQPYAKMIQSIYQWPKWD